MRKSTTMFVLLPHSVHSAYRSAEKEQLIGGVSDDFLSPTFFIGLVYKVICFW